MSKPERALVSQTRRKARDGAFPCVREYEGKLLRSLAGMDAAARLLFCQGKKSRQLYIFIELREIRQI
jgi:hypothetical protein